jgi:gas vesicle protein
MSDRNSKDSLLKGLLIGLVSGAIFTLLSTPKSGKELRGDLKESAEELPKEFQSVLTDIKAFYAKSQDLLSAIAETQYTKVKEAVVETKKVIDEKLKENKDIN